MIPRIETRLNRLLRAGEAHRLGQGLKGVEKESLRLSADGLIATTPHPRTLGSALTHPYITTDYSEALPELITPPFADPVETLAFLDDLHRYVYARLESGEFLLATSMPVGIDGDASIPVARYGNSNIGRMKHVYRQGLSHRYGRSMQAIAGVHFNYSVNQTLWPVLAELEGNRLPLQDYIASAYFGLIRNVHRYGWLIIYLFGASPAVDKRFFRGRESLMQSFEELDSQTLGRTHATSLRMSDIGYRIDTQPSLDISCNSLEEYVAGLTRAISQPHPAYEAMGLRHGEDYRQLNTHLLQIENEYYSSIRPKQLTESGEKPTLALRRRGVRYVELRSLDLCCTRPGGVSLEQLRFLEVFLLLCLLADSPPLSRAEQAEADHNALHTACCGRMPATTLRHQGGTVSMHESALHLFNGLESVARVLDGDDPKQPYRRSVLLRLESVLNPEQTPSWRMLTDMRQNRISFTEHALALSRQHADYFRNLPLAADTLQSLQQMAVTSLQSQQDIEASDTLSFADFLANYFGQH